MNFDIQQEDEYFNRKLIWNFEFPNWVVFENLPNCVTLNSRYWWMTSEQMDWFYKSFFKGHKDEGYFSKPFVKYTNNIEVENCKDGIDRNIKRVSFVNEDTKRQAEYKYLKSGY